jgi:hypothetical protein
MVTPIEVVDTAVKIGLGALISGVAGYFIARLNLEKDRAASRRQTLESIADQVQTATEALTSQDPKPEDAWKSRDDFLKAFPSIEAKLLLLGEKHSLLALRDYMSTASTLQMSTMSFKRSGSLDQTREKFFDALSQSYGKL